MSKKLLSVVLALALVCSVFAVASFAIGGYGFESEEDLAEFGYAQTWALDEPVDNGNGTYSVNVRLTANYTVGPIEFSFVKNVSAGSLRLTGAQKGSAIPANWNAAVSYSDATNKVIITARPTEDAISGIVNPNNAVVAVLTFTASDDVAATLAINVDDAYTKTNPAGTLIAARMSDGNVVTGTAICGQTVNATNTVTIGAAASTPPTLAVVDGTIGVIDTSRTDLDAEGEGTVCDGYLYGFDLEGNADVSELFMVVGDGTMNVVENSEGLVNTTGTMVQVVDLDGIVVAEYVLIVFGDVNGDALIDGTDASVIELHEAWEQRVFTYQEFAGDVNVDGITDGTDASICELHDAWEERIDVATVIAALGF